MGGMGVWGYVSEVWALEAKRDGERREIRERREIEKEEKYEREEREEREERDGKREKKREKREKREERRERRERQRKRVLQSWSSNPLPYSQSKPITPLQPLSPRNKRSINKTRNILGHHPLDRLPRTSGMRGESDG